MKKRLAIFASGHGSNANVLMKYFSTHSQIEVAIVVSNNPSAGVLEFAKKNHIESRVFTNELFTSGEEIAKFLKAQKIDYIILSGFLRKIPEILIEQFPGKIINIHPALLPKFGGKGMYGKHVHEAVYNAGETETGITIHLVDNEFDHGDHIAQFSCPINTNDSVGEITKKVQSLEYLHFAPSIERFILC